MQTNWNCYYSMKLRNIIFPFFIIESPNTGTQNPMELLLHCIRCSMFGSAYSGDIYIL